MEVAAAYHGTKVQYHQNHAGLSVDANGNVFVYRYGYGSIECLNQETSG
jgi:hypothetical protein